MSTPQNKIDKPFAWAPMRIKKKVDNDSSTDKNSYCVITPKKRTHVDVDATTLRRKLFMSEPVTEEEQRNVKDKDM